MSVEPARLRSDLVISPQASAVIVKDPATGRFYRFGEAESFVLRQLDGATSADAIRQRVEATFHNAVAPGQIEQFIDRLARLGLLQRDGAVPAGRPARGRRVLGTPLYLRFKAFDPDRLFNRLIRFVQPLFTWHFVALSAALIIAAIYVNIVHWDQLKQDFRQLYRLDTLLLVWLTVLAVSVAHEFAHGLTCKHFGGEVHEIGFMLIFFQPAFYCNVSDAWLFPQKARRLWVTFAGAYFELVIWALATLIWRATGAGTPVGNVALVVLATSGIKTLFNFNPLLKFDGYYLLSDFLEIPNLRQRSFAYLRSTVRRLWGGARLPSVSTTPRERWIYVAYGLLAGAYSTWLLTSVTRNIERYLVGRFGPTGFVLLAGFLVVLFWYPLKAYTRQFLVAIRSRRARAPLSTTN